MNQCYLWIIGADHRDHIKTLIKSCLVYDCTVPHHLCNKPLLLLLLLFISIWAYLDLSKPMTLNNFKVSTNPFEQRSRMQRGIQLVHVLFVITLQKNQLQGTPTCIASRGVPVLPLPSLQLQR